MNFKEFFARFQLSAEGRHQMGEQSQNILMEKYQRSGAKRQGISFEDFKDIRAEQMHKLHCAYDELNQGKFNKLMGPRDVNDVSEDAVRRVTGPNMTFNTGFLAVDQTDRDILSYLTTQTRTNLTAWSLKNVIDGVEAMHAIAEKAQGQRIDIGTMLRGSDVLKTEVARADITYNEKTYGDYTRFNPPAKGLLGKISKAFRKFADPQKYAEEQARFDNQEVPGIE